jgi:hypothetical protein
MKTFLLVDNHETDKFISERILRLLGIERLQIFDTVSDLWGMLKDIDSQKTTLLLDLMTLTIEDIWFIEKLEKLTQYKGEFEIYLLTLEYNSIFEKTYLERFYKMGKFKGLIQKPLTEEKVKILLDK